MHGGEIQFFMPVGILLQIRLGQPEQRGGGAQPVFLQVHKRAGELDQALVKVADRSPAVGEPQILQYLVRLEKKLAVEAGEIAKVARVHVLTLKSLNDRKDAGALFTHASRINDRRRKHK